MSIQIVLINSANCELDRIDVPEVPEADLDEAIRATLCEELNDLNWILAPGDVIRIEEVR